MRWHQYFISDLFSFKKQVLARLGFWVIVIGLVANTGGILLRWVESYHMGYGHAPFSNMYESLVFFSWTAAALYVFCGNQIQ